MNSELIKQWFSTQKCDFFVKNVIFDQKIGPRAVVIGIFEHWDLEMRDLPVILKSNFLKKEWNSQFNNK